MGQNLIFDKKNTISQLIEQASNTFGNDVFLSTYHGHHGEFTYHQVYTHAHTLALWMIRHIGSKKNIALVGRFSAEWVICFFAIQLSRNIAVTVDHQLSVDEMEMYFAYADVSYIFYDEHIPCRPAADRYDTYTFSVLFEQSSHPPRLDEDLPEADPRDAAMIVFTSGTSGKPKGVVLSNHNIISDVYYSVEIMGVDSFHPGDSIVAILPPFHLFQITTGFLAPICYGVTIGLSEKETDVIKSICHFKPSVLVAVPSVLNSFRKLLSVKLNVVQRILFLIRQKAVSLFRYAHFDIKPAQFAGKAEYFGGNLSVIVCGGAFVDDSISSWFDSVGITLLTGYGITECSPVVACNTIDHTRTKSVGMFSAKYCNVTIEDGEILVRGDIVFHGYYRNEDSCIDSDGWFHTGDLGYIDQDKYLYITGRKKDILINDDGNNISPEKIENLLMRDEKIDDALVYLLRLPTGVCLAADICLANHSDAALSEEDRMVYIGEVIAKCNQSLQRHEQIIHFRPVCGAFEKNHLGKKLRYKYVDEKGFRKEAHSRNFLQSN